MTAPASAALVRSEADDRRALLLFSILAAGAAGMAALLALLPAAGHDQLWFLLMGRRWLAGATLYGPQAFDSNPPGVIWLSAVPVWLGALCHVPATVFAKLLVTLLEAACALLSFALLPYAWRPVRRYEAVALLFAAVVLFYVVPARDFGQRDHLVGFLLIPYVLSAGIDVRRSRLGSLRMLAGVLAAVAICLKPHHALVPLVIETALLISPRPLFSPLSFRGATADSAPPPARPGPSRLRQWLRPEPMLIGVFGLLYLAAIHRFAPLYLSNALPITRSVYWAIGHLTLPQLLGQAMELCVLSAVTVWLFLRQSVSTAAVRLLLLAGSASFAAYLLQGTGWYYQQLPAISFFGVALALELLDLTSGPIQQMPRWLPRAAAALILLALALTTHFTGYPFTQDRAFAIDSPDPAFFASLPPDTPVAILTTSVEEAMMPVERYHLIWAQRTNNLWLLPAILRSGVATRTCPDVPAFIRRKHPPLDTGSSWHRQREDADELSIIQHCWMVEDFQRWQPQLVLVERCQDPAVRCQVLEDRDDNLLAWFKRDPAFAALWQQHYTFAETRGRFDAYRRH